MFIPQVYTIFTHYEVLHKGVAETDSCPDPEFMTLSHSLLGYLYIVLLCLRCLTSTVEEWEGQPFIDILRVNSDGFTQRTSSTKT